MMANNPSTGGPHTGRLDQQRSTQRRQDQKARNREREIDENELSEQQTEDEEDEIDEQDETVVRASGGETGEDEDLPGEDDVERSSLGSRDNPGNFTDDRERARDAGRKGGRN